MTTVGCALLCAIAALLFWRELRLWRTRDEIGGPVFRYSRRRFVRRTVGCVCLAAVGVLTWLGLEVLDFAGRPGAFQAYWAAVGALCLALLVIPILDFRETYKQVVGDATPEKLRRELERLREERDRGRGP